MKSNIYALLAVVFLIALWGCAQHSGGDASSASGSAAPAATAQVLRIGHQKADALALMQLRGTLEKTLEPQGVKVEWLEFTAGPQLIEALSAGSIDLGITGESPVIFAQASGVPVVYLENIEDTTPAGDGLAILVPKNSSIKTPADLKGKKVAVARGSTGQNFLLQILQRAGLTFADITPAYLAPPDARAAFDGGQLDAWAVWDPYLAAAQKANGARILVNAKGIATPGSFFLSTRSFATANPALLHSALSEIEKTIEWQHAHLDEAADMMSKKTGIDKDMLVLLAKEHGTLRPIDDKVLSEQQQVADNFYKIGIVPKKVDVRTGALTPAQYSAINPGP